MKITGLFVYPIKSCRGTPLSQATVLATGLRHDRRWMLVNEQGRFITQREQGKLALIEPQLHEPDVEDSALTVTAYGMPALCISASADGPETRVKVWDDVVSAFDGGDEAAAWFTQFLGTPTRLVRFNDAEPRASNPQWTGNVTAYNRFSDGFPLLLISQASLDDLNSRMDTPLPMNRFRPNLVVDDLPAYGEDVLQEFGTEQLRLRVVKPCTRCKITTTDQNTGLVSNTQPLATLMQYRRSKELRGVMFGQNVIVVRGAGAKLQVGQTLA